MNSNQNNSKKVIYQYSVNPNTDINFDITRNLKPGLPINIIKVNTQGNPSKPALIRATKSLQLTNPFKGV